MTTLAAPTAVPTAPAPKREHAVIHSLEELLIRQVEAAMERAGLTGGRGPVFLYGAGQHTWWLLRAVPAARALPIAAIVDDAATTGASIDGISILRPDEAIRAHGLPRAVLLSTDAHQSTLAARSRAVFGPGTPAIDLYHGLPPGPYWRGAPLVARRTQSPLLEPSDVCLRRSAQRLAPWLCREEFRRVLLIGESWQTWAVASCVLSHGIEPVFDARRADAAIVCNYAAELGPLSSIAPGLKGPLLTLWRGARPWLGAEPPKLESDRPRILLRFSCGDEHAAFVLENLVPRLRDELQSRPIVGAVVADAVREFAAHRADQVFRPRDAAGAWDAEYTITDPPPGTAAAEWAAIQTELPPSPIGASPR